MDIGSPAFYTWEWWVLTLERGLSSCPRQTVSAERTRHGVRYWDDHGSQNEGPGSPAGPLSASPSTSSFLFSFSFFFACVVGLFLASFSLPSPSFLRLYW